MNRTICKYLSLSLILSIFSIHAVESSKVVTPRYFIRSQGTNAVRRVVQTVGKINRDEDCSYGTFSITPEYTRSFKADKIAECLFGDALCGGDTLLIQGSDIQDRNKNALFADYFYLPTDFDSTVSIKPLIQNFLVDFNFFRGFNTCCMDNLYVWVQAPITWTKWSLGFNERVNNVGENAHDEGYFTPNELPRDQLLKNFSQFARGLSPNGGVIVQEADKNGLDTDFATVFQGLDCARMCPGSDSNTRISEIRFALGWNFLMCDNYHIGAEIQASAPTGNKVRSDLLFAVQNGNDHHWELGGAITAHYSFCHSEDEEDHYGFYLDANITHMFKNSQRRCFDVCDKPLSRYMLVEKLGTPIIDGLVGSETNQALNPPAQTVPSAQFQAVFAPLANVTSLDVDVKINVKADVVFWFNHTRGPWSFDLGYNFWGRSCEKISIDCDCPQEFQEKTWAFKGASQVYGFANANNVGQDAQLQENNPVALSATMSKATIFNANHTVTNDTIDNDQFAYAGQGTTGNIVNKVKLNSARREVLGAMIPTINTSIDPIFIKQEDINFASVKGISNKIFSHIGYTCEDEDLPCAPYFGVGFEAEFGQNQGDNCDKECDKDTDKKKCNTDCEDDQNCADCVKCALSQWGVWAKFGVSFN